MFDKLKEYGTEQIHFCNCEKSGLKAIIAIHSTVLGPSTGGTRFWPYANDGDALYDVLRLSKGMTYKCAVSGLKFGGAKGVIIGDPKQIKTDALLEAYGAFVDTLGGNFTTGEDVNITVADVNVMARRTKYLAGIDGQGRGGDPSPYTARGVYRGLQAGCAAVFGTDSFKDKTVAVQGLGKVGYDVCRWLHDDGARLIVSDINPDATARAKADFGATVVSADEILFVECDALSPNALGAVFSAENAARLRCKLIGGGANNVLVDGAAGAAIDERGILYIPDYVINAGGVISVSLEIQRIHTQELANEKMDTIYTNVKNILDFAQAEKLPTYLAADRYGQKIVDDARNA